MIFAISKEFFEWSGRAFGNNDIRVHFFDACVVDNDGFMLYLYRGLDESV